MVDILGYSLPGVVASFLFMILGIKQPDNLRVTGPTHPVLARVKEDALLTCQLLPKRPTRHMEVRWYRSEPGTPIFVHQDGAEVTEMQMEEYGGRVEWIENGAAEGSVALRIHDIRPSDNGQYWCRFQEGNYCGEASLLLKVGGVGSAPDIHVEGSVENGVQLVCTATGWFPEPQVHWEDNQGKKLLTASEHHFQDEDGLYYVETTLVLRNVSAETVSCVIHNPVLNEEKRSVISLPEKLQSELASLKVIGTSQPILVKVGEDTQLTCSLSPKAKARGVKVRGVRSHRCPAVHVDVDGDHVAGEQMAEYRGRTTLVSDAIDEGRLTLQIHNATTSDAGQYQCLFEKDDVVQEASLVLMVEESRMPFLMLILCILGPLLVLSLIWMKRHIKVNAKLDSSTASTKLIPSKGDKGVTHGHFHNQTSHRDLTTISPSWPTRVHTREVIPKGRCLGQKEMDHKFCQGQYHKPTISDETPHRDWIIRPQSWLMRIHTREVILTDKCLGQKGIDHEFCQERLKATTSLLSENEL